MTAQTEPYPAYIVDGDAWYAEANRQVSRDDSSLTVMRRYDDGSVEWEFVIGQVPGLGIQVRVFDEAFAAFDQAPRFFDALAAEQPTTLDAVAAILDRLGYTDVTDREREDQR